MIGANQDTGAALGPVQSYYERDGLGSVITLSDPKGNVTQSYRYSAFGETYGVAPADTNPYRYTGEYADEVIGLQYNRARVYDATVGRFISLDSYDPPPQMVDLVNKYYYASGDPVDEIDPSGETTTTAEVTIANEQGQKIKVAEKEGAIGEFKKFLFGGSSNNPAGLIGQLIVDEAKGALEDMIMDSAFNGLSRTLQGTRVHLALEKRIKALNESLRKSPLFRNIEIRAEFFVNGSGDEVGRRARGSLGVDVIVFWHHERMLAFDLKLGRKMGRTRGNKLAALIGTNIIEISVHR